MKKYLLILFLSASVCFGQVSVSGGGSAESSTFSGSKTITGNLTVGATVTAEVVSVGRIIASGQSSFIASQTSDSYYYNGIDAVSSWTSTTAANNLFGEMSNTTSLWTASRNYPKGYLFHFSIRGPATVVGLTYITPQRNGTSVSEGIVVDIPGASGNHTQATVLLPNVVKGDTFAFRFYQSSGGLYTLAGASLTQSTFWGHEIP